jgi:hypothetical protein
VSAPTIHVNWEPYELVSEEPNGEVRWCFVCRKRVPFVLRIMRPVDRMSYYGPNASVKCERGHQDGDCFPGTYREWEDA